MEDKSIAVEQEASTGEAADSVDELICPIDEKPWDESACAVMEQRVAEKVLKRLQSGQAPEEVVALDDECPELSEEPDSGDELVEPTDGDPTAANS